MKSLQTAFYTVIYNSSNTKEFLGTQITYVSKMKVVPRLGMRTALLTDYMNILDYSAAERINGIKVFSIRVVEIKIHIHAKITLI